MVPLDLRINSSRQKYGNATNNEAAEKNTLILTAQRIGDTDGVIVANTSIATSHRTCEDSGNEAAVVNTFIHASQRTNKMGGNGAVVKNTPVSASSSWSASVDENCDNHISMTMTQERANDKDDSSAVPISDRTTASLPASINVERSSNITHVVVEDTREETNEKDPSSTYVPAANDATETEVVALNDCGVAPVVNFSVVSNNCDVVANKYGGVYHSECGVELINCDVILEANDTSIVVLEANEEIVRTSPMKRRHVTFSPSAFRQDSEDDDDDVVEAAESRIGVSAEVVDRTTVSTLNEGGEGARVPDQRDHRLRLVDNHHVDTAAVVCDSIADGATGNDVETRRDEEDEKSRVGNTEGRPVDLFDNWAELFGESTFLPFHGKSSRWKEEIQIQIQQKCSVKVGVVDRVEIEIVPDFV